jgi:hypothetical protein
MASSGMSLDMPPPQPPDVTSQMGASPFSGVSSMLQQKAGQGGEQGGGANPKGALLAQSEAVKKVVDQMAKMEPGFAPFADRIRSLLDAGVGAVTSGGSPQPGSSAEMPPKFQGPATMRPGEQGANASGQGFPG